MTHNKLKNDYSEVETVKDAGASSAATKSALMATAAHTAVGPAQEHATETSVKSPKAKRQQPPTGLMASDGLPLRGYARPAQIYGPIGPLPISRSQFWSIMKAHKIVGIKLSPRVTVFDVEAIRNILK